MALSSFHPSIHLLFHKGENRRKKTFLGSRAPCRAGRNSSISAGMNPCNSSQQISLAFRVFKGHLCQSLGCVTSDVLRQQRNASPGAVSHGNRIKNVALLVFREKSTQLRLSPVSKTAKFACFCSTGIFLLSKTEAKALRTSGCAFRSRGEMLLPDTSV